MQGTMRWGSTPTKNVSPCYTRHDGLSIAEEEKEKVGLFSKYFKFSHINLTWRYEGPSGDKDKMDKSITKV
jgi:hypothetical protein